MPDVILQPLVVPVPVYVLLLVCLFEVIIIVAITLLWWRASTTWRLAADCWRQAAEKHRIRCARAQVST